MIYLLMNHRREGAEWSIFSRNKRRGYSSAHQTRGFFSWPPLLYTGYVFSSESLEKTAWKLPDMIRSNQTVRGRDFTQECTSKPFWPSLHLIY